MNIRSYDKLADKLVNAFLKNKIIKPLPLILTKKIIPANQFRKHCESKISDPIIGFKAGGTGIPLIKKLKEKEPFYASVFKKNFLKSGKKVKINKSTLGIELEVCYLIKKSFFKNKKIITKKIFQNLSLIWLHVLKLSAIDKEKKVLSLLEIYVVILVGMLNF